MTIKEEEGWENVVNTLWGASNYRIRLWGIRVQYKDDYGVLRQISGEMVVIKGIGKSGVGASLEDNKLGYLLFKSLKRLEAYHIQATS